MTYGGVADLDEIRGSTEVAPEKVHEHPFRNIKHVHWAYLDFVEGVMVHVIVHSM